MVVIMMLAIKARREPRASSQIDSGDLESIKILTEQSKTVDSVNFIEGGKKKPLWSQ